MTDIPQGNFKPQWNFKSTTLTRERLNKNISNCRRAITLAPNKNWPSDQIEEEITYLKLELRDWQEQLRLLEEAGIQ